MRSKRVKLMIVLVVVLGSLSWVTCSLENDEPGRLTFDLNLPRQMMKTYSIQWVWLYIKQNDTIIWGPGKYDVNAGRADINGIPVGGPYFISAEARDTNERIICLGESGTFYITAGQMADAGALTWECLSIFDMITYEDIASAELSGEKINASDDSNNQIPTGAIVVYKTSENRYGKFLVVEYGYSLHLKWLTYDLDQAVYSSGENLVIRGTHHCDLDEGLQTDSGADFWYRCVTDIVRWLKPQNGATFCVYYTP